ncbi:hypothetical protein [Paraburkholderia phytofirmans]|uniref:Uncharacterized protein n=1 Tax=Paraburkholderia phytofirmans OLGA172 TaxID=1417228 RepID=A0A160FTN5_9BURK|nr:hypothetical protein [Paraburkholderia phytofirmans]ANB76048.1 hypothetical protein AYM40_27595 [Paraburkholderia phytofirmans OLGA172]
MNQLLASVLRAHGGVERWNSFSNVAATIVSGGQLLDRKAPQAPEPRRVMVSTHRQASSITPFGTADRLARFTPNRVTVETLDGDMLSERTNPREHFAGHDLDTAWDPLDRAYFGGYTQWIYLNAPFMFTLPGVTVEEGAPLRHGDETWRALRVTLPPDIVSHSAVQTFYFGDDFLLRRQDYTLDIAGGCNVAHYTSDLAESNGLLIPNRRRAYLCDDNYNVLEDRLLIWIDYTDIQIS